MSQTTSVLDHPKVKDFVLDQIRRGQSNRQIANLVSHDFAVIVSEAAIRRAKKRWGVGSAKGEPAGTNIDGDKGTVTSEAKVELSDPPTMLTERGLNPEEWDVQGIKVNEWDSPTGEKLRQMTLNLVRKKPVNFIRPARPEGWKPVKRQLVYSKDKPYKVIITGDQQAPFHDEHLHELVQYFLDDFKPREGVMLGDTVDFPDISRHRFNPEATATVNQCIDAGYGIAYDYVQASPDTWWRKLEGNHDERLRNIVIDWTVELYGVRRALRPGDSEEASVLSIPHLLRLDELGIDYVSPGGQYEQGQIELSKYLAVRHGWIAQKGSGASALKTLEQLGYSIIVGHTHRQALVHKTTHDINGNTTVLAAAEAGCMCRVDLGYAVAPDWQNGFTTATIWPDGTFNIDLATYVDKKLLYRDRCYT